MSDYQTIYTTTAINTGGRNGVSYIDDGSYEVKVASPTAANKPENATNPEQLFALGYSACFNSALEGVMAQEGIKGRSQVSVTIQLLNNKGAALDVKLQGAITVAIEGQTTIQAQELAEKAHTICPYSRATLNNMQVTVRGAKFDENKHD